MPTSRSNPSRTGHSVLMAALLKAAEAGDLAGIQQVLAAGAKPKYLMGADLSSAAKSGPMALPIIKVLLAAGSNPDNVITEVANAWQVEILQAFREAGARLPALHRLAHYPDDVQCTLLGYGPVDMLSVSALALEGGVRPAALCLVLERQGYADLAAVLRTTGVLENLSPEARANTLDELLLTQPLPARESGYARRVRPGMRTPGPGN